MINYKLSKKSAKTIKEGKNSKENTSKTPLTSLSKRQNSTLMEVTKESRKSFKYKTLNILTSNTLTLKHSNYENLADDWIFEIRILIKDCDFYFFERLRILKFLKF